MKVIDPHFELRDRYDVVAIGSGFGTSFLLDGLLRQASVRHVLIVEWGADRGHAWQIEHDRNSAIDPADTFDTPPDHKPWNFTIGLGGGMNCWWGQSPRLHPSDFELRSRYGVGRDWPLSYDDLEPYYGEAEAIMSISGDPASAIAFPHSRPFPQPPHRMSTVDRLMKAAQPDAHFVAPTARARIATGQRPACCANARCSRCPVDAKFTAHNGMRHVFDDPRVEVALNCRARSLETAGGMIDGVVFDSDGESLAARCDLCVLGANAIHSPHILLRSGIDGAAVGQGLHEQLGCTVEVYLDGIDHFDGSTVTTGLNVSLLDGEFRREAGAAIINFHNHWHFNLRPEYGRWRQTLPLFLIVEDLPQDANRVHLSDAPDRPWVSHADYSDYARRGVQRALDTLPGLLAPLPVEAIHLRQWQDTGSHLQGTLRMGLSPSDSVVDAGLIHHQYRNLVVVGTAVFPSCSALNPSLTAAALSLRAAGRLS